MKEIEAIKQALAAGPTPGPWERSTTTLFSIACDPYGRQVNRFFAGFQSSRQRHEAQTPELVANAMLAAACNPKAMSAVLAHIEEQAAEIERLRRALRLIHGKDGPDCAADIYEARAIAGDALKETL